MEKEEKDAAGEDSPPKKKRLISNPPTIPKPVVQTSKDSNVYTLSVSIFL